MTVETSSYCRFLWPTLVLLVLLPGKPRAAAAPEPVRFDPPARLARDLKSPWTSAGATTIGAGAALTGLAMLVEDSRATAASLESSPLEGPIDVGDTFGNGMVIGGGALALTGVGGAVGSEELFDLGLDLSSAYLASGAYAWSLKLAFDRRRPSGGPHSFPSGHTTAAFSAAAVIDRHAGWQVSTLAYGLAVGTALGRLEDRRHHLSDVAFGAALGMAVGGVHPASPVLRWLTGHVAAEPGGVAVHGRF